ncbi:tumor necrosis factor receptor superfamily member 5 isoform X2 [Anoplopoma fimbria]|nr:tumor necrosis factor receptor superfamily member 5 isoform X2 [Anoplopoma fimbria]
MQPLCCFVFTFLCSISFVSPGLSIHCNNTQYLWPVDQPKLCCNKCPPGKNMIRRPPTSCGIECEPCSGDQYSDAYNEELSCEFCENCDKPNMEYGSHCNATHNAVCRCKTDYRCKDRSCQQCVLIPSTTTKPTLPPSTTVLKPGALTTLWPSTQPIRDTVWFLVIIAILCVGIAFAVVTKIKPFMRWIKSKQGYIFYKGPSPVTTSSEEEEVSTPVQEVLGKFDV